MTSGDGEGKCRIASAMTGNANGAAIHAKLVSTGPRTGTSASSPRSGPPPLMALRASARYRQPGRQVAAAQQEQGERGDREDERLQDVAEVRACPTAAGFGAPSGGARDDWAGFTGGVDHAPFERPTRTQPVEPSPRVEPRGGVGVSQPGEVDGHAVGRAPQLEDSIAGSKARSFRGAARRDRFDAGPGTDPAADVWRSRGKRGVRRRIASHARAVARGPQKGLNGHDLQAGAEQRQRDQRRDDPHRLRVPLQADRVPWSGQGHGEEVL